MNSNLTSSKDIRKFGVIAFVFFGGLSGIGFWANKAVPTYLFGTLSVIGCGFILMPYRLKPVYAVWLKIAHFVGKVVTTLVLALAYYFVITPAALLKRLFGDRPLPVKPDKNTPSYWVARTEPAQPKERFIKRY